MKLHSVTIIFLAMVNVNVKAKTSLSVVPYKQMDLGKECGKLKQSLYLHNQAHQFIFNSTNKEPFKCHLELHLHSDNFGFSIFINSMRLDRDCNRDFLQFGRDWTFITSSKSDKKCGVLQPYESEVFKDSNQKLKSLKAREYIENTDKEMDVWLAVNPPGPGEPAKYLSLTVTPFKKKCNEGDQYYRKCPGSEKCIKHELFCDGIVNCDGEPKDEQEEYCLVNSSINNVDMFLSIPILILIIIFALLGVMFVIFMLRLLYISLTTKRHQPRSRNESERRALHDYPSSCSSPIRSHLTQITPESPDRGLAGLQTRLTSNNPDRASAPPPSSNTQLPPHPPSYNEVMGVEFKEDPPKYSETPEEAHLVIDKSY